MQHEKRSTGRNPERSAATRQALVTAARALFVEAGYAQTSTPDIVRVAGVTRGALYHHFADKAALFRAVVADESAALARDIAEAADGLSPRAALIAGSHAYLGAMAVPGRTRLLLIDAPAVLGPAEALALDEAHAARALREGLAAALAGRDEWPLTELANLLSAAFDRAALAIAQGGNVAAYLGAMTGLIERIVASADGRMAARA